MWDLTSPLHPPATTILPNAHGARKPWQQRRSKGTSEGFEAETAETLLFESLLERGKKPKE